jgi:hypothetical protein
MWQSTLATGGFERHGKITRRADRSYGSVYDGFPDQAAIAGPEPMR